MEKWEVLLLGCKQVSINTKNEKSYWDVSRSPLIINLGSSEKCTPFWCISSTVFAISKVSAQDNTACMLSIHVCALYNGSEILLYETDWWTGKWQLMWNSNLELERTAAAQIRTQRPVKAAVLTLLTHPLPRERLHGGPGHALPPAHELRSTHHHRPEDAGHKGRVARGDFRFRPRVSHL